MIDYFTPPTPEVLEDVKSAVITIWSSYDDTYGYASEKIQRVKDLCTNPGNFMTIIGMLDSPNQEKLSQIITPDSSTAIRERMIVGGAGEKYIPFK